MGAPYVLYPDDLEQRHPDENRLIDEIIASFERQNRKTFDHYRHARVTFPSRDCYSPARRVFGDDVLSFSPAHGLLEHRPLGSIMRARMKVYGHSARFRREMNARPSVEPRSIDEIPD